MANTGATVAHGCTDPVILDQWWPLTALPEVPRGEHRSTLLLGIPVDYGIAPDGTPWARRGPTGSAAAVELPVRATHGYLWTTLGRPAGEVFAVAEADEPDRRTLNAITVGIEVSPGRAVENFLDMAHFPYVHTGILGEEPRTEVVDYRVEERDGELWAVDCFFHQPLAAAASSEAAMTEYRYRVPHPYAAMLYKSSPADESRMDAIGIFIHPVHETRIRAHLFLSLLDERNTDSRIRRFQQVIIGQDKPILENQYPKLLPLDPRAETPIRADRAAIAYRRWLREQGVTYGVIPAEGDR